MIVAMSTRPADTLSSRGEPRNHKEAGEQGQEAAVHGLLTINAQVEGLEPSYTETTAMAIVPLPLAPGAEARALHHHLLEHGDIVGRDPVGRTIIQLAVDDRVLERLLTFDADAAELEDGGEAEPDADDEQDGPPVLLLEIARPKLVKRRRPSCTPPTAARHSIHGRAAPPALVRPFTPWPVCSR